MPDLTDIRGDDILIHVDADAKSAIQSEMGKWSPTEKEHVTMKGDSIYMPADPTGEMDEKRKALIDAVNGAAKDMTAVVRVGFDGPRFAFIIGQVAKPPEGIEK